MKQKLDLKISKKAPRLSGSKALLNSILERRKGESRNSEVERVEC